MFYVLTYDIASAKRLGKMLRLCRKYLHWVQRSVFEGELTETQFEQLRYEIKHLIDKEEDSVITYQIRVSSVVDKKIIGIEKCKTDIFL